MSTTRRVTEGQVNAALGILGIEHPERVLSVVIHTHQVRITWCDPPHDEWVPITRRKPRRKERPH